MPAVDLARPVPYGHRGKASQPRSPVRSTEMRVADGIRTRDHRDHNPGLYQLSYRHHARDRIAARPDQTSRLSRYAASRVSGNEMRKKSTITAP